MCKKFHSQNTQKRAVVNNLIRDFHDLSNYFQIEIVCSDNWSKAVMHPSLKVFYLQIVKAPLEISLKRFRIQYS